MRQQTTGRAMLDSGEFIERRTRDADEILTSLARYCEQISDPGH